MSKKRKAPPEAVSAHMAQIGARGGAVKGKSKRRGGKAYYRRVAEARWGKRSTEP